jgi:hypothetical protein
MYMKIKTAGLRLLPSPRKFFVFNRLELIRRFLGMIFWKKRYEKSRRILPAAFWHAILYTYLGSSAP